jgi:hypothetical protein
MKIWQSSSRTNNATGGEQPRKKDLMGALSLTWDISFYGGYPQHDEDEIKFDQPNL